MNTPVRKRKSFSAQEKLQALEQLKKGKQQTQLARDLGIIKSTLRGWKKEEKFRSLPCVLEAETSLQRKKVKFANDEHLDSELYRWLVQAHSEGVPISGPILKAQAEKFDRLINGNESKFKASNVLMFGEIRSADKELLKEGCYTADQVYNCDETGLCFQMLPNRTHSNRTDSHKQEGFKQRKDRVTLLFCVNKSHSHKVRPLMIGKVSSLFEGWFHKNFVPAVRAHLRKLKQEEKALFLLDRCPAHPPVENLVSHDGKIKVSYLLKYSTSEIQPLDQGIILAFKQNYHLCHLSGKAWDAISEHCIERRWIKSLGPAFLSSTHDDGNDDEPEFTKFTEDNVRLAKEALKNMSTVIIISSTGFQQMTSPPYMNTSQMTKLLQMSTGRINRTIGTSCFPSRRTGLTGESPRAGRLSVPHPVGGTTRDPGTSG
uniref:HTH CENPB-type domain-containing protein n=1 Tax=Gopherus agassizii TaxID=38772 RepID=A0A452GYF0_9SAUR